VKAPAIAGVALVLSLLSVFGCSEPRTPAAPEAAAPAPATPAPIEPVATPAPKPRKREGPLVKALQGELLRGGPLTPGQQLAPDSVLVLKKGAELTLDFTKGMRLVAYGPAELVVGAQGEQAVLLREGTVQLDLPPSAPTAESGFLAVTPGLHLAILRGGRLALRAFSDASSETIVVSGMVAAVVGAEAMSSLSAGQSLRAPLAGPAERAQLDALTLEAALERLKRLPARKGDARVLNGALDGELQALVDEVEGEMAREAQLVAAHRERIGTPDALAAQRDVAMHAGLLARARGRMRGLMWRRGALRLSPPSAPDDPLGQRAEGLLH
jgi:hypothetical protein